MVRTFLIWALKCVGVIMASVLLTAIVAVPWLEFLEVDGRVDPSTPMGRLPVEIWTLCASLIIIGLFLRYLDGLRFASIGLVTRGIITLSLLGMVIGLLTAAPNSVIPLLAGQATINPELELVAPGLIAILALSVFANALFQQLVFRGYVFHTAERAFGLPFAIIASTLGFVLIHGQIYAAPGAWIAFANLSLAGLSMAFLMLITRNIWMVTGYHWGWNFSQAFISEDVTNKAYLGDAPLIIPVDGARWFTGGNLEHDLIGLIGPALVTVVTFMIWRQQARRNG